MSYNPFSSNNNNTMGEGTNTMGQGTNCACKDSNGNTCNPTQPSKWNPMNWFSGGRRRTVRRGGGFRPSTDINVATTASHFSGGRTAQPHNWTGGKRRRSSAKRSLKCKKCSKRRRYRH